MCVIAGYAQSGVPRPQSRKLTLHHLAHIEIAPPCLAVCGCHCRLRTIWCAQASGWYQRRKLTLRDLAHTEIAPPCLAVCVCHCRLRTIWCAQALEQYQRRKLTLHDLAHNKNAPPYLIMCVIAGYAQSGVPRPQSRLRAENSHCTILHTLKLHHHVLLCVCHCRLRTIWCAQNGITQKTHIAHLAHIETAPPCLAVCVSLQATHDLVCPGLRADSAQKTHIAPSCTH